MRMEWIIVKSLAIFVAISLHVIESEGKPQIPCFFIFGDSLSDSGNNNNLATMSKANFLPYGIDFPDGPTGRFTNGRTVVDFIGDFLGLEGYIPPFSSVKESEILKGVNYASASSGILEETGYQVGMRIGMDQQMKNHEEITSKIAKMMGSNNSSAHLNKCLYSVNVGSNDWMVNYFFGTTAVMRYPNNQDYAQALITQLSQQLTKLYNSGARKVIVFGLTPLGCLPTFNTFGRCSDVIDDVLEMYNTKLRSLVDTLNTKFKDANFIWINSSSIVPPNNFQSLGFKVTDTACCNAIPIQCIPSSVPCANREDHAFWDNAHMTEAAYRIWATRAFNATQPTHAYPMDINHLAQLQ